MTDLTLVLAAVDSGSTYTPWRSLGFSAVGAVAFLISILVRRPLIGVVWVGMTRRDASWRATREGRRPFTILTWIWAAYFAAQAAFQWNAYGAELPDPTLGWWRIARLVVLVILLVGTLWWLVARFGAPGKRLPDADEDRLPR